MWRPREKSMQMPQKPDGLSVSAASGTDHSVDHSAGHAADMRPAALPDTQSNTNGPGDCLALAVQVTEIPKMVICSEPP